MLLSICIENILYKVLIFQGGALNRLIWATIALTAECVLFSVIYLLVSHNLSLSESKHSELTKSVTKEHALSNKFKQVTIAQNELDNYFNSIDALNMKTEQLANLLLRMAKYIPKEAWISNFKKHGEDITIEGYGGTNEIIVEFTTALHDKRIFSELELIHTKKEKILNNIVYSFKLVGKLKL